MVANKGQTMKAVDTIQFTKDGDDTLMLLINNYVDAFNKHVMTNNSARNVIRNFLLKMLPGEIDTITGGAQRAAS